ncbi:MAG: glycosyltransferase, partial [Erysipelotrichaceae bacterium]|nr:glycosyltransferase [Erysipelotrichaceae bacterium]
RNYAFEMSRGEYVMFHDADDLITKGHILSLMDVIIQRGTDNSAAFSDLFSSDMIE